VTQPISIEGQQLSLARMEIGSSSQIADKKIGDVEDNYRLTIILLRHNNHSEMHPNSARHLHIGDTIAVFGGPDQLKQLMQDN
jgi:K+/H+ antiporter YhaU regulatory subunit KhtT